MVTMAAPLKFKGLFTFFLSIFSRCSNGFNIFLIDGPLLHLSLWYIVVLHFVVVAVLLRHYLAPFFLAVGMIYLGGLFV